MADAVTELPETAPVLATPPMEHRTAQSNAQMVAAGTVTAKTVQIETLSVYAMTTGQFQIAALVLQLRLGLRAP